MGSRCASADGRRLVVGGLGSVRLVRRVVFDRLAARLDFGGARTDAHHDDDEYADDDGGDEDVAWSEPIERHQDGDGDDADAADDRRAVASDHLPEPGRLRVASVADEKRTSLRRVLARTDDPRDRDDNDTDDE